MVGEWHSQPLKPEEWGDLGWHGTSRQVNVDDMIDVRIAAAIEQRAAELGIEVTEIAASSPSLMIVTGTAKTHLGADKLIAYIDGLRGALTGSYGNPPVEVGRKDLTRLVGAVTGPTGLFLGPGMESVIDRMRQALREPPQ